MVSGEGENSYAANSRLQEKAILETRPLLHTAIEAVCTSLSAQRSIMVVVDLRCSSGPNTLCFISEVIGAIRAYIRKLKEEQSAVDVQFLLNDLPGNDFNLVFRSIEQSENLGDKETPPYYVAGLPRSYYRKLFPCRSVQLFHSSYSLMWRSQVPEELSTCTHLNEGNIYIGKNTPPMMVKLFQEQFRKDFELFLALRFEELVSGGRMLLTFLGRKSEEMMTHGDVATLYELLAESPQSMVLQNRVEKEKLDSFNLPYYTPSMKEVRELINKSKLFNIEHIKLYESNWDPQDDLDGDLVLDCASSGANVSKCIRAVLEPLIVDHFGEEIIEELFVLFSSIVAKHLENAKAKYPIITVSLKKAMY